MRAIVYEKYGGPDVLSIKELETPSPERDEILVKIHATTVTTGDFRARSLTMPAGFGWMGRLFFGISKPRQPILGTELAGTVVSGGKDVTKFQAGDEVFAFPGAKMGCHAEYRCLRETSPIAKKPKNISFEQAAALCFGGTTALDFFRRGKLKKGEKVLVNGASGGVGSAAVQLARHFGAEVTGVCSTRNLELVRALGAKHVVDYTTDDFTKNGEKYDVIVDIAGTAPFSRSKRSLTAEGRLLLVLGDLGDLLGAPWVSLSTKQRVIAGPAAERAEDLAFLAQLAEAGELEPVIDQVFPFEQIALAHERVDTGHKRGSVVVKLA
jgi:NADPH:quinone reductase-like Zn-dependent oxidoreductase